MPDASATARRLRAPARREQLLDVAAKLAVEQGFHAVSVDAVARGAGITRGLIYQHFGDRQGLLEAVIEREMSRALAQVSETTLSDLTGGDPKQLMLESLESFLRAVADHPTTWRLVLMPSDGAPESLRESIAAGRHSVLAQMTNAVGPALQRGDLYDAELTARILSSIADEYARLVLTDVKRYPPQRLLKHARWWLAQASFGL